MADGGPAALAGAAEALDANFGELLAWYASWPGGEVRRDAELQLASTGVRFRAINTAALAELAPATAADRIDDAVAWLSARTDRWRWLVGPTSRPLDLEDRLIELGPQQGVTITRGVMHRPRAPQKTVVLMVETSAIVPTGD